MLEVEGISLVGEAHSPSPLCLEARKPTLLLHTLFWGMPSAPALPSHLRVQCQPHSLMPASLFIFFPRWFRMQQMKEVR